MTPKRLRKGGESYGSCTASASRTCRQIGERGLERGVVGVLPVLVEVQGKPTVLEGFLCKPGLARGAPAHEGVVRHPLREDGLTR